MKELARSVVLVMCVGVLSVTLAGCASTSTQRKTGTGTHQSTGTSTQQGTGASTHQSTGASTHQSTGTSTHQSTGTSTHQSGGNYFGDYAITAKVKAAFAKDSGVSAMHVHVTTNRGVVELTGSVSSQTERNKAQALARTTPGVKFVTNKLVVKAK